MKKPNNARQVASSAALLVLIAFAGCASVTVNDPWKERSAQQNERVAENWRSSGGAALGQSFDQQAERDRQAARKNKVSLWETILDGFLIGWLDEPASQRRK